MYDGYEYMVSIICETYNHAPYVRQCIEGFLMQKTDFAIEILIHDDASSDGTPDIIREYAEKHPDLFKPIYQVENQYSKGVNIWHDIQFPRARGKYIAICEGDDYWTDPLKLQKQVEFLERNAEYVLCCHNAQKFYVQEERFSEFCEYKTDRELVPYDAIHRWIIATASMVIRREMCEKTKWEADIYSGDYSLILRCLYNGKIFYFHDIMSVYRFNMKSGSMTSMVQNNAIFVFKQHIKLLSSFLDAPIQKHSFVIKKRIIYLNNEIIFNETKNAKSMLDYFIHFYSGCKKFFYNNLFPLL